MRSFFYSKYFQTITKTPKEPYFNMTLWVFLNHWVKLKFLTHQNNLKRENLKYLRGRPQAQPTNSQIDK
jgi:hypothetical protein